MCTSPTSINQKGSKSNCVQALLRLSRTNVLMVLVRPLRSPLLPGSLTGWSSPLSNRKIWYTIVVNNCREIIVYKTARCCNNFCNVLTVLSFSSFMMFENDLNPGTPASPEEKWVGLQQSGIKSALCNWKATLSLVVMYPPLCRIRARAKGISSLLQLETPSAITWTLYPPSIKSRADCKTQTCDWMERFEQWASQRWMN